MRATHLDNKLHPERAKRVVEERVTSVRADTTMASNFGELGYICVSWVWRMKVRTHDAVAEREVEFVKALHRDQEGCDERNDRDLQDFLVIIGAERKVSELIRENGRRREGRDKHD